MSSSADPLLKSRRMIGGYALAWYMMILFGIFAFTMERQPLAWWMQLSFFIVVFPLTLLPLFLSIEADKPDRQEERS